MALSAERCGSECVEYSTLKLTELKLENHTLSKSEKAFFEDERTLKKNYLKPIKKKEL